MFPPRKARLWNHLRWILAACAVFCASPGNAATLKAGSDGIRIDAGTFGNFVLTYPVLDVGQADMLKPSDSTVTPDGANLKYPGGTRLAITVRSDGEITYTFGDPAPNLKSCRIGMLIDFGFSEGGTWKMGENKSTAFPQQKPAKPHLYQGNDHSFVLTNFEGKNLTFSVPSATYEELTDNREWNWKIFNWMFLMPCDSEHLKMSVTVQQDATAAKRVVVVDRFGQDTALEFPGKVKSEDELKQDVARDAAYYGSLHSPERDTYGGLPGSRESLSLKRTGFFHVEKKGERWLLVDPEGNACFHLGVCGFQPGDDFTYVKGRESVYEWLPPYDGDYRAAFSADQYWSRDVFSFYVANQIRKYGKYDPEALQSRMIDRVRKFGFNAVGAFSGVTQADRDKKFPWADILPLGAYTLGGQIDGLRGLFDPFDSKVAAKMDEIFAKGVAAAANEPLLVGYFLDNEQAFEDIPRVVPGLKGDQPAKRKLMAMLQDKYRTIAAFNTAWGLQAADFASLRNTGLPVTTQAASADMNAFTGEFIETYYKLIHDTFRKYDRNHMLMGNRWQPITANNEQLCRIAGKYNNLISLNYYTYGIDSGFLKRLYTWCGEKPFLLSEFYWSSPSDTGLPGGSEVKSQRERGLAYRNYVEQAASTRFVVGIEWFILIDQARTGRWFERFNGEKANTGLFSVADRPYKGFLSEAAITNNGIYDVLLDKRKAFAWDDPRFQAAGRGQKTVAIPRAVGPIKLDGSRNGWPGTPPETISSSRLVIGADSSHFDASFKLCWDDSNLYVLVQVSDPTPMRNSEQAGGMWNGDGSELFIGHETPNQEGPLLFSDRQVLLSAGSPADGNRAFVAHAPVQHPCRVAVIPSAGGQGYTLEAAIPFEALGFVPRAGQAIRFDLAVDDGNGDGRQRQLMWSGGARNSGDRTDWGRATFMGADVH